MTVAANPLPMVLTEVTVTSVEALSPSFLRIELAAPALADFGVEGPLLDQRFKLVVPHEDGGLTSVDDADESWLDTWMRRPVEERGHMRTYTVRSVRRSGADTRLVVDVVRHEHGAGPGAAWAMAAKPGDRAVVMVPRRGMPFGGIEFTPPAGAPVLLAGDETAAPAICAILECLPATAVGSAFVEVPVTGDVLDARKPAGVEVTWLPRNGGPHGERLHAAVVAHLGGPPSASARLDVEPQEVDPDLWETPSWSSSGESIPTSDEARGDLFAWIAGEAAMVTGLRRHLVRDLGMDRRQVAFMGYWRHGVAMKS